MSRYATAFGRQAESTFTIANPSSITSPAFPIRVEADGELEELSESIRHVGIVQPIILRRTKSGLELVAGSRRLKAAKRAGLTAVPVILLDGLSDVDAREMRLIENLYRKDISDYEKGRALQDLLKFKEKYPNQEALAKRLGKDQPWISHHVQAYELAEELKNSKAIMSRDIKPDQIEALPERHLRVLSQIPADKRAETLEKLIAQRPEIQEAEPFKPPPVRELEREAKELHEHSKPTGTTFECVVCGETLTVIHHSKTKHSLKRVLVVRK